MLQNRYGDQKLCFGQQFSDRAVLGREGGFGNSLKVVGGDGGNPIGFFKQSAPISGFHFVF
jgi:hypothetical protein